MKRTLYSLFLFLFLFRPLVCAQQELNSRPVTLAFRNVIVIDVTAKDARRALRPNQTVVVSGGRIAAVGSKAAIPEGALVVDATGKYLIPGLWDMHVHTLRKERVETFFPLFVVNGVTGVRDMGTPLENFALFEQWRREIAEGARVGPRIVAASPFLDGAKPAFPNVSLSVSNEKEAREGVRSLKRRGVDFIKVYHNLSREAFFAIADESERLRIPFAGHVPLSVSAAEASEAGQKSMEHLIGVSLSSSTDEEQLRAAYVAPTLPGGQPITSAQADERAKRGLETYSEKKAEALFRVFVRNGTWHVPTLSQVRDTFPEEYGLRHDELQKYMLPSMRAARREMATADEPEIRRRIARHRFEIVRAMHRAGVRLMAGTDTSGTFPNSFPGFGLHDELALLVRAGLTPLEALQAGTINPAQFLRMRGQLGSVEQGKAADMVLLDANPLENIRNTQKIAAVVINGRYLPSAELQKILSEVEAAANKK